MHTDCNIVHFFPVVATLFPLFRLEINQNSNLLPIEAVLFSDKNMKLPSPPPINDVNESRREEQNIAYD